MFKMMELSKSLQEDIKKNQLNLKVAIKNHQTLVLKLRGSYDDPNEIKQQLTDIQKHIISLGEAQKVLVARVKKEIAAKSWNNNNNSIEEESHLSSECPVPSLTRPSTTTAKIKNDIKPPVPSETEQKGKRRRDELDFEDEEDNDDEDEDEEIPALLSTKRHKPMLSVRRPSTPASAHDFHQNDALGSSSEDSEESAAFHESSSASEVNKEQFMSLLNLITKDTLTQLQSKHRERKRRRLAGHHSLYTSHWDLTVQRRNRTRLDRDTERQQDVEREESPIGSPPIVEIKKDNDSSSDSTSQSPPPLSKSTRDDSAYRNVCVICRKQGILSICDSCSATYHWSCLDKIKNCPQCQVGQIGPDNQNISRSGSPSPGDDALSKVLGDTSKPPTRVSSKEVIERYNRNIHSADESNFAERLKVKKKLEARKAALKMDLTTLEEKAAKLSESIVNQNANMKELTAGEEKIRERIKKVVDFISCMKRADNVPS